MTSFQNLSITVLCLAIGFSPISQAADRSGSAVTAVVISTAPKLSLSPTAAPQQQNTNAEAEQIERPAQEVQQRRELMREMRTIGLSAATIAR